MEILTSYLDKFIPTCADDNWVLWIWAESDAGDPFGMTLIGNCELAVSQSVPELDRSVSRARNNLSVVCGERNGKDIVGVADESSGGVSGGKFPKAEGLVPG